MRYLLLGKFIFAPFYKSYNNYITRARICQTISPICRAGSAAKAVFAPACSRVGVFVPRALPKRSCVCYTCAMEKVAIVGGGAGGLFCAARLLQKGIKPVILEAGARVGKKILVSGNGRCNLSNQALCAERYNAPDFVAPVLRKYAVEEVMRVWRGMGLVCRSDAEGRIFPYANHSGSVLNVLLRRKRRFHARI